MSKREAVASFIGKQYPNGIPSDITGKQSLGISKRHRTSVSERTVGRAKGRRYRLFGICPFVSVFCRFLVWSSRE